MGKDSVAGGWLEVLGSVLGWKQVEFREFRRWAAVLQDWSLSTRCHYYCSKTGTAQGHWGKQPGTGEISRIKWQKGFKSWAGGGCPSEGCSPPDCKQQLLFSTTAGFAVGSTGLTFPKHCMRNDAVETTAALSVLSLLYLQSEYKNRDISYEKKI